MNITNNRENSDQKHWSHVDYVWCTFDSTTRRKTIHFEHGPQPEGAILVPISEINNPQTPEEKYVQRITLTTLDDLYRLADQFDRGVPKPLYRGQSNYSWNLKTQLELNAPEFVIKKTGLEIYEYQVLSESQRRFHEFLTQLPDENDRLSWLALLRHRGVPTRLLDVTRSLFIACYFALRDAKPGTDAAIWIFARDKINNSFHRWGYNANKTWLRESTVTVAQYNEPIYWPFPKNLQAQYSPPTIEMLKHPKIPSWLNFDLTLDAAMRGFVDKPGVAVVEPFWLSRKMDFQQGAFLIPFNVRFNFEHNLFSFLDMSKDETEERNVPTDPDGLLNLWNEAKIIKLRVPADLHGILKIKLEAMNIRELTLFPDVDGALSHLNALVPRQGG